MTDPDILYVEDIPKLMKQGVFKGKTPCERKLVMIVVEIGTAKDMGAVAEKAMYAHLETLEIQVGVTDAGKPVMRKPTHIILNGNMQTAPIAWHGPFKVLVQQTIFYVLPPYTPPKKVVTKKPKAPRRKPPVKKPEMVAAAPDIPEVEAVIVKADLT